MHIIWPTQLHVNARDRQPILSFLDKNKESLTHWLQLSYARVSIHQLVNVTNDETMTQRDCICTEDFIEILKFSASRASGEEPISQRMFDFVSFRKSCGSDWKEGYVIKSAIEPVIEPAISE